MGFDFQSNLKYKYEKIRNPKVYLRSEIEDKKRKVNEGNDFLKNYYKEYDVRKRKLKVNLSTKEYFYNKLFDKLKSSQV